MGLATARAFAAAGAAAVLADVSETAVSTEAQHLIAAGHRALAVRCDVSDDAQVAAMIDRNNASVGALTGNPGIASYIASKHGVIGLTRTAALEYVKQGIRVGRATSSVRD